MRERILESDIFSVFFKDEFILLLSVLKLID